MEINAVPNAQFIPYKEFVKQKKIKNIILKIKKK